MTIQKVYLSQFEEQVEIDYNYLNTDVIVDLDNGDRYKATFISLKALTLEFDEIRKKRIGLAQKYYWSRNIVIVNSLGEDDLLPLIDLIIEEGDFQMIFEKL